MENQDVVEIDAEEAGRLIEESIGMSEGSDTTILVDNCHPIADVGDFAWYLRRDGDGTLTVDHEDHMDWFRVLEIKEYFERIHEHDEYEFSDSPEEHEEYDRALAALRDDPAIMAADESVAAAVAHAARKARDIDNILATMTP